MRMFLYRLRFFLVFLVAMAMSRTRASRLGCQGTRWLGLGDARLPNTSLQTTWARRRPTRTAASPTAHLH